MVGPRQREPDGGGLMRIVLFAAPDERIAGRLRAILKEKSGALGQQGVAVPGWNPVRLFLAAADPARLSGLHLARGVRTARAQGRLAEVVGLELEKAAGSGAGTLALVCGQLGRSLIDAGELERLRAILSRGGGEVEVVLHLDEQARTLAWLYADRVGRGRVAPLSRELEAAAEGGRWWDRAVATLPPADLWTGVHPMLEAMPAFLDYTALLAFWESAFGAGRVQLRGAPLAQLYGSRGAAEVQAALGLSDSLGNVDPATPPAAPGDVTAARMRSMNPLLRRYSEVTGRVLARDIRGRIAQTVAVPDAPIQPGALAALSKRFATDNASLAERFPGLSDALRPDPEQAPWQEPDPQNGYRATQYLAALQPMLARQCRTADEIRAEDAAGTGPAPTQTTAPDHLPPLARMNFDKLRGGPFAPHNRLGGVDEAAILPPYPEMAPRALLAGSTGNVIVGCMKNEAPYILEWVAYHRAIGVDDFLIYTNACDDGTDAILDRLQAMGILQHRDNDGWKGKSPQQHALNSALKEPVIRDAEWVIHIDVDEFINVRCGNGTLPDLFARAPDATNWALTWRLFGHNGVDRLDDRFVIEQFDTCAPAFCPKPHTVWGFKSMVRNVGAYAKLSCHRPNKLREGAEDRVKWVNGSGQDITRETAQKGWRSSKSTIGYDLVQLNHYALRSAESFLIKRQRGRALHVDRSIGLNYWIRMDWSDVPDVTIKRNVPRVRAEYDRLLADPELAALHRKGLEWHRAKADELHAMPEFEDLYRQALALKLTDTERVAYALALDMES